MRRATTRLSFRLSILGAASLVPAFAASAMSVAGTPDVSFHVKGTAGMSCTGKTDKLAVADDGKTIAVTVPLDGLSTGIALRDKHMKEKYLEVPKYPDAELDADRSTIAMPADPGKPVASAFQATLKLHGQSQPVTVHYKATSRGNAVDVDGSMSLDMTKWGITQPSYMGITIDKNVDVDVKFQVQP